MATLTLELANDQLRQLQARAEQLGYPSITDYMRVVVEGILEEEPEAVDVLAAIREGLEDVRAGRTFPARDLDRLLESDEIGDE